jgi:hypothetical protein
VPRQGSSVWTIYLAGRFRPTRWHPHHGRTRSGALEAASHTRMNGRLPRAAQARPLGSRRHQSPARRSTVDARRTTEWRTRRGRAQARASHMDQCPGTRVADRQPRVPTDHAACKIAKHSPHARYALLSDSEGRTPLVERQFRAARPSGCVHPYRRRAVGGGGADRGKRRPVHRAPMPGGGIS